MPEHSSLDIRSDDMRSLIEAFPRLLTMMRPDDRLRMAAREFSQRCEGVCLVGMGGSAIAGEMSKAVLENRSPIPILSVRHYTLPKCVDERWATIAVSYSGNTEETIQAAEQALERDSFVIGVTSGGRLSQIINKGDVQFIAGGLQPRAALPLMFSIVHPLVEDLCGIPQNDNLVRVAERLEHNAAHWGSSIVSPKEVARRLLQTTPLFLGAEHLAVVAYRAKCQVNENAKRVALFSEIPEMNHNEIEALTDLKRLGVTPIVLRSVFETERMRKRLDVMNHLLERSGLSTLQSTFVAESLVEECLMQTHYLDTISLELAELVGVDPLTVPTITQFKMELE